VKKVKCRMRSSTIDRLLKSIRKKNSRRGFATTKPGNLLKNSIPMRTFADWNENRPGFMEIDLVAHCGDSVEGYYLNTLCAINVAVLPGQVSALDRNSVRFRRNRHMTVCYMHPVLASRISLQPRPTVSSWTIQRYGINI